jgi:hypothetical protein
LNRSDSHIFYPSNIHIGSDLHLLTELRLVKIICFVIPFVIFSACKSDKLLFDERNNIEITSINNVDNTRLQDDLDLITNEELLIFDNKQVSPRDRLIRALLLCEESNYHKAEVLINSIFDAQYTGPIKSAYGNFPLYVGDKPPFDNNWSAFIGTFLAYINIEYGENFSHETQIAINLAIEKLSRHRLLHLKRRPGVTNINILSSYFLLQASKLLNDEILRNEAVRFWDEFYKTTKKDGISEYNGLNYVHVHLYGLEFIWKHEQNSYISKQAKEIQKLILWNISSRYHFNMQQLAGPFSRTPYNSIMSNTNSLLKSILINASDSLLIRGNEIKSDRTSLHNNLALLILEKIPETWINKIAHNENLNKHYREKIKGDSLEYIQITSYMTPTTILGSVSHAQIKYSPRQQSRPIIGHVANNNDSLSIGEFRVLFFNEHKSDVKISCNTVQYKTNVLASVFTEITEGFKMKFEFDGGIVSGVTCQDKYILGEWNDSKFYIAFNEDDQINIVCNQVQKELLEITLDIESSDITFVVKFYNNCDISPDITLPNSIISEMGGYRKYWKSDDVNLEICGTNLDRPTTFLINSIPVKVFSLGAKFGHFTDHN